MVAAAHTFFFIMLISVQNSLNTLAELILQLHFSIVLYISCVTYHFPVVGVHANVDATVVVIQDSESSTADHDKHGRHAFHIENLVVVGRLLQVIDVVAVHSDPVVLVDDDVSLGPCATIVSDHYGFGTLDVHAATVCDALGNYQAALAGRVGSLKGIVYTCMTMSKGKQDGGGGGINDLAYESGLRMFKTAVPNDTTKASGKQKYVPKKCKCHKFGGSTMSCILYSKYSIVFGYTQSMQNH